MLWRREAGAKQWAINLGGLAGIAAVCWSLTQLTQAFSPSVQQPLSALGLDWDTHVLQWIVVAFGMFVILNLFQSLKISDRPVYNVVLSPSLILLMVVGGLQTAISYGMMGFTPSFLIAEYGLSQVSTALQFGLLAAGLGIVGPLIAGPLSDWLAVRMGARGRVWLTIFSLGVSPLIGVWTYSAGDPLNFYMRFSVYSVILMLWLPPIYALCYDLVLPRMRGITSSIYIIISTLLGLGMGPYFVGIIADQNGGDLGKAIMSVNVVAPLVLICLFAVLWRIRLDESTILERARAPGERRSSERRPASVGSRYAYCS